MTRVPSKARIKTYRTKTIRNCLVDSTSSSKTSNMVECQGELETIASGECTTTPRLQALQVTTSITTSTITMRSSNNNRE